VATYVEEKFLPYNRPPLVRKAQARDYRRHLGIVVSHLGKRPLAKLVPDDIRGLQAELLAEGRSPKYVKNILSGSLRALIAQALEDRVLPADPFPRRLKWPKGARPKPDPLTATERTRVLDWFTRHLFGFHPGRGSMAVRRYPHPAYHAFLHTLFWTGLRPSEAAGLQWGDVDLKGARFHVQRSRHLGEYNDPKTESAERWVELVPETVRLVRDLQPLHVTPETPIFTTTTGTPIEPKTFSKHWYDALRACGIRQRGLYTTKDTFVHVALKAGVRIAWLEQQTGVAYATLRKHYGGWITGEGPSEVERFAALEPGLFSSATPPLCPRGQQGPGTTARKRNEISDRGMRGGGLEPDGGARQVWIFQRFTSAGIRK
jgi:integrase